MIKSLTRGAAQRADRSRPGFPETQFVHSDLEDDYTGFAPTEILSPDERVVPAAQAARVARIGARRESPAAASLNSSAAARAAGEAPRAPSAAAPRGWFARLEDALERVLPGHLGGLLQLFVCVSLSMALLSAMLPMIERV